MASFEPYGYKPSPDLTPAQQAVARAVDIHWGGVTVRAILRWIEPRYESQRFSQGQLHKAIAELVEMGVIRLILDGVRKALEDRNEQQLRRLYEETDAVVELGFLHGYQQAVLLPVGGPFLEDTEAWLF